MTVFKRFVKDRGQTAFIGIDVLENINLKHARVSWRRHVLKEVKSMESNAIQMG